MKRTDWIISPIWDLALVVAGPLLIAPLVWCANRFLFSAEHIALAVVSFASIGHHLPGYMRAYGDRQLFRQYRSRLILAPPLAIAAALIFAWSGRSGLTLLLLFWATWHVLMQTYGFMRIYDVKQGINNPSQARLDFALCVAIFTSGVVFSSARVFAIADLLWQVGFPLFGSGWLSAARYLLGGVTAILAILFLWRMFSAQRQGQPVNWIKLLLVVSTGGLYWYSGAISQNVLIGVALFEIFHAIQYNAFVWHFNCRAAARSGESFGPLRHLFQDRALLLALYLAAIAGFGSLRLGAEFVSSPGAQVFLLALLTASTLLHFYFDGFIWKVSQPSTQRNLDMATVGADRRLRGAALLPVTLGIALTAVYFLQTSSTDSKTQQRLVVSHLYALTPDLSGAQTLMSRDALVHGDVQQAIALATQVIESSPKSHQAHADLGLAYLKAGDFVRAVSSFQAAIRLRPELWQNYSDLGMAFSRLEQWDAADNAYRLANQRHPSDSKTKHAWGAMCAARQDYSAAVDHWRDSVALDSHNAAHRADLVIALGRMERHDESIGVAQAGLDLAGGSAAGFFSKGAALVAASRPELAILELRQSIAIDSRIAATHFQISLAYLQLDRVELARESLEKAIELEPTNVEFRFQLGNLLQQTGQLSEAVLCYRRCIDLQPEHAAAYANLGSTLLQQGDPQHALQAYRRACLSAPTNATMHFNMGQLLIEQGQLSEGAKYLLQARDLGYIAPDAPLIPDKID